MKAKRGLFIVFGALIGLFGLVVLAAGGALLYADRSLKDDEGYFGSRMAHFEAPGRAMATQGLDLTGLPVGSDRWADFRVRVRAENGRPIFVGIAREADVRRYLTGVPHVVLTDVDPDSFRATYRQVGGTRVPPLPATRKFWAARVQGPGLRTLNWSVEDGSWQVVAMNADAGPGVSVDASIGVKIPYTLATAILLLVVGLLLAGGGLAMLLRGDGDAARRRTPAPGSRRWRRRRTARGSASRARGRSSRRSTTGPSTPSDRGRRRTPVELPRARQAPARGSAGGGGRRRGRTGHDDGLQPKADETTAAAAQPTVGATAPAPAAAPARTRPQRPSAARRLTHIYTITGDLSPKSVVASQRGLFFAQNMIYRHTISVYDRRFRLVKTIPDLVDLGRLGPFGATGTVRGGPVEAAFSPDGRRAYVSNYSMYGPGYGRPGDDVCSPGSGIDASFVYRIDVARLRIDRAIKVGAVPKFLAVTPDDRYVLVSNWCTYDLSVVSVKRAREVKRIPLGAYPRGIAIGPGGGYAYVAVMGSRDVARISLKDLSVSWLRGIGSAPRHLVMDPGGDFLYATLNAEGRVVKVDLRSGRVVASIATGSAPRSMAIAGDGRSLYVVNYNSSTVSKVRTRDMRVLQTVSTNALPIGIDYDNDTHNLWVACYTGSLMVFRDA